MMQLDDAYCLLEDPLIEQLYLHEHNKQLVYRRGPLVFAFNFHPTESFAGFRIPVPDPADYRVVLDSDLGRYEGHNRVQEGLVYPKQEVSMSGRAQSLQIYLPNRTAQVLAPVSQPGPAP